MSPAAEVPEEHWATQLYEALALRGIDPHDMQPNYTEGECTVIVAIPSAKVALATEGDVYEKLERKGWNVTYVPLGALKSWAATSRQLAALAVDARVRVAGAEMIKIGSKEESRLLDAMLRANLPEPNRNLRFVRDGAELTVPDFAWESQRVAFYVDGLWWHHGRDSDERKKRLLAEADKDVINEAERQQIARATRDADARSELAVSGWLVLSCSTEDLETDAGIAKQVDRIKRALKDRHAVAQTPQPTDGDPVSLETLLG